MTYDGVHPNAEGEIHMADRWLAAVESYLTYP
jgi:lysophospholipase L1-like esterase